MFLIICIIAIDLRWLNLLYPNTNLSSNRNSKVKILFGGISRSTNSSLLVTPHHITSFSFPFITWMEKHGDSFKLERGIVLCTNKLEFLCTLHDRFQTTKNNKLMEAPTETSFKTLIQPTQESKILIDEWSIIVNLINFINSNILEFNV